MLWIVLSLIVALIANSWLMALVGSTLTAMDGVISYFRMKANFSTPGELPKEIHLKNLALVSKQKDVYKAMAELLDHPILFMFRMGLLTFRGGVVLTMIIYSVKVLIVKYL